MIRGLPSTFLAGSAASESCVTSAAIVLSASALIEPPFSASAFAAMLAPSLSTSADCTLYANTRVVPVLAEGAKTACRRRVPIDSASCGFPPTVSTATLPSKTTWTRTSSP